MRGRRCALMAASRLLHPGRPGLAPRTEAGRRRSDRLAVALRPYPLYPPLSATARSFVRLSVCLLVGPSKWLLCNFRFWCTCRLLTRGVRVANCRQCGCWSSEVHSEDKHNSPECCCNARRPVRRVDRVMTGARPQLYVYFRLWFYAISDFPIALVVRTMLTAYQLFSCWRHEDCTA